MKGSKQSECQIPSEVVKLTAKLSKDPTSKLFMPLAEQYIKCGMLDEAVKVLRGGLKIHPHFLSAKVVLGKAYLKKGQIQDAKTQFEEVITACPDNLFAHRKLVGIYRNDGNLEKARKSCDVVLSFYPMDAKMKTLVGELDRSFGLEGTQTGEAYQSMPDPQDQKEAVPVKEHSLAMTERMLGMRRQNDKEIMTASLADIYIKQGYYKKGMEIYKRLLACDPSNSVIVRKLEDAEILIKLRADGLNQ